MISQNVGDSYRDLEDSMNGIHRNNIFMAYKKKGHSCFAAIQN